MPLAFSQLAHWNLYQLGERPSQVVLSHQIRIRGLLDLDLLRKSVAAVMRHHDALRTRIIVHDRAVSQMVTDSFDTELEIHDLSSLEPRERESEVTRRVDHYSNSSINVTQDPLFGVKVLIVGEFDSVLILTLDHIVSDGFSMNVLLRHLLQAYAQLAAGHQVQLPVVPVQFSEYAVWQNETQQAWVEAHGAYWKARLAGCGRMQFPADQDPSMAGESGWGLVPIIIGKELKAGLQEWCRQKHTTLVMSVFTAYVALVLRWCEQSDGVVLYQSDGRLSEKLRDAIGYFAAPLFLRFELLAGDTFADLLGRVTEEYCRSYEHADFSWIEAQMPRPGFTRNGCFNWLPHSAGMQGESVPETDSCPFNWSMMPVAGGTIEDFRRDTEPMVGMLETEEEIQGWVMFPLDRFSPRLMGVFARNFLVFVNALIDQPQQRVGEIPIVR